MSKSVDIKLVEAAREGDPGAFRLLYDTLAPGIYRTVLALVKQPDEAQDVVQDTFIAVHAHLDRFRGEADIRTWVTRIALNRARDVLRRARHAPRSLDALPAEEGRALDQRSDLAGAQAPLPDPGLERLLWAAVDRLPPDFRICFVLREVSDLSYEEIAAALKISVGTVRSRLSRAREQLRRTLEPRLRETPLHGS